MLISLQGAGEAAPAGSPAQAGHPAAIRRTLRHLIAKSPVLQQQVRLARRAHSLECARIVALDKVVRGQVQDVKLPLALVRYFAQPELQARLLAPYRRRSTAAAAKAEAASLRLTRGRERFNYLYAEFAARFQGRDTERFDEWQHRADQASAAIWPHFDLATALYEIGKLAHREHVITRETLLQIEGISGWRSGGGS